MTLIEVWRNDKKVTTKFDDKSKKYCSVVSIDSEVQSAFYSRSLATAHAAGIREAFPDIYKGLQEEFGAVTL